MAQTVCFKRYALRTAVLNESSNASPFSFCWGVPFSRHLLRRTYGRSEEYFPAHPSLLGLEASLARLVGTC